MNSFTKHVRSLPWWIWIAIAFFDIAGPLLLFAMIDGGTASRAEILCALVPTVICAAISGTWLI